MSFLKLLTLAALFVCTNLYAKVTSFSAEQLSLNFVQNDGRAHVNTFSMGFDFGKLDLEQYDIDILKSEGKILLSKNDTRFQVDGIDQSVLDAISALSASRIDVRGVGNKSLFLHFEDGSISLGEDIHGLSEMNLNCSTTSRGDDTLVSFLIPCFDDGTLEISEIRLAQSTVRMMQESFKREDKGLFSPPRRLEDVQVKIKNQQMEMSVKARFLFRLKLTIKGTAELNQKKNIAIFDIQEAKVGFISVHRMLLNLLAKIDVTNIIVEGSTVTIKL